MLTDETVQIMKDVMAGIREAPHAFEVQRDPSQPVIYQNLDGTYSWFSSGIARQATSLNDLNKLAAIYPPEAWPAEVPKFQRLNARGEWEDVTIEELARPYDVHLPQEPT
jgi:hypothetical protein